MSAEYAAHWKTRDLLTLLEKVEGERDDLARQLRAAKDAIETVREEERERLSELILEAYDTGGVHLVPVRVENGRPTKWMYLDQIATSPRHFDDPIRSLLVALSGILNAGELPPDRCFECKQTKDACISSRRCGRCRVCRQLECEDPALCRAELRNEYEGGDE